RPSPDAPSPAPGSGPGRRPGGTESACPYMEPHRGKHAYGMARYGSISGCGRREVGVGGGRLLMAGSLQHAPVLLRRSLELLEPALANRPAVMVDAAVGHGGHAAALLGAHPALTLIGIDRDQQTLGVAGDRLRSYTERVHLVHGVYDELPRILRQFEIPHVDGVLFDLGVSSLQLDTAERGFSYARDAALDMRMDPTAGPTAADVLNRYPEGDLRRVLREYGEERFAGRIAAAVVAQRARQPFETTAQLVDVIY